jgi:hypothetical protein
VAKFLVLYITKTGRQLIGDTETSIASTTDVITEQLVVTTALQIIVFNKTIAV